MANPEKPATYGTQDEDKHNKDTAQYVLDTTRVIRFGISKKNRQHNGQKKRYKRTNNDLQNTHIKLKIE
jgi:hypothetical protein